jgi:hypothetical protein
MADTTLDKATLQSKITRWKIVLWAVIIIAAALLTYLAIKFLTRNNGKPAFIQNGAPPIQSNSATNNPPIQQYGNGPSYIQGGFPPANPTNENWTSSLQTAVSNAGGTQTQGTDPNSHDNIKGVQHMLNTIIQRQPGQALLVEDGIMGPLTEAALKSVNPSFYPLTSNVILQLSMMAADIK